MPRERKEKFIFAAIIALVLIVSNLLSNNKLPNLFGNKEDDKEIIAENELDDNIEVKDTENQSIEKTEMKAYISGEVNNSGVYVINEGDRLEDLVKKAGGLTEKADKNAINLALRVEDQMKIYIPNIDEHVDINDSKSEAMTNNNVNGQSDKININLASKEELKTLPNIGEKRAEAIIQYRENKRFEKIEDIKNVRGIGEKYFEAMKDMITV